MKRIKLFETFSIPNKDLKFINENEGKFPEQIWGEGKLPPLPDQQKWDMILAQLAYSYDNPNVKLNDLVLTIGGIASGKTTSGAYTHWLNSKKKK